MWCNLCIYLAMASSLTIWYAVPGVCEARVSWLGGHADDYCFPVLSPLSGSANPAVVPHWTQSPSFVLAGSVIKHIVLTYLETYISQQVYHVQILLSKHGHKIKIFKKDN